MNLASFLSEQCKANHRPDTTRKESADKQACEFNQIHSDGLRGRKSNLFMSNHSTGSHATGVFLKNRILGLGI